MTMQIKEMIDVLLAYETGKKIQFLAPGQQWRDDIRPSWNFLDYRYRIAPTPRVFFAVLTPMDDKTGCVGQVFMVESDARCVARDDWPLIKVVEQFKEEL